MRRSDPAVAWRRILLSGFFMMLLPAIGHSQGEARLEAEDYAAKQDYGGIPIQIHACNSSSQGLAVDGLDLGSEWIAWDISLSARSCFVDSLRSAGAVKQVRTYRTTIERLPSGEIVDADTVVTRPGSGFS